LSSCGIDETAPDIYPWTNDLPATPGPTCLGAPPTPRRPLRSSPNSQPITPGWSAPPWPDTRGCPVRPWSSCAWTARGVCGPRFANGNVNEAPEPVAHAGGPTATPAAHPGCAALWHTPRAWEQPSLRPTTSTVPWASFWRRSRTDTWAWTRPGDSFEAKESSRRPNKYARPPVTSDDTSRSPTETTTAPTTLRPPQPRRRRRSGGSARVKTRKATAPPRHRRQTAACRRAPADGARINTLHARRSTRTLVRSVPDSQGWPPVG